MWRQVAGPPDRTGKQKVNGPGNPSPRPSTKVGASITGSQRRIPGTKVPEQRTGVKLALRVGIPGSTGLLNPDSHKPRRARKRSRANPAGD
jgi:hypothetical protein